MSAATDAFAARFDRFSQFINLSSVADSLAKKNASLLNLEANEYVKKSFEFLMSKINSSKKKKIDDLTI